MKRESMSKNEVLSFLAAIKYFEHEDGYCHFVKSKICKLIGSIKNGEALTKSLNYLEENPDHTPTEISKNLKISRTTVYKYI